MFWMASSDTPAMSTKSLLPWPRTTLPLRSITPGSTGWLPGPARRDSSTPLTKTGVLAQNSHGLLGALMAALTSSLLKKAGPDPGVMNSVPELNPSGSKAMGQLVVFLLGLLFGLISFVFWLSLLF